jgi:hypothetical protein
MYVMGHCENRIEPYSAIPHDDISTCDGLEDSTSNHEKEVSSTPFDEFLDYLGVDTPMWVGTLV